MRYLILFLKHYYSNLIRITPVLGAACILQPSAVYSQTWYNLGSGVYNQSGNAVVYSISCDTARRMLYAGGNFDTAGGITAQYIASWNGNSWDSVGGGVNAPVQVTLFYHDTLYAGGDFTMAAGISLISHSDSLIAANRIALWNGTEWDTLGGGMNGSVYALAVFNGNLYAGGDFTSAGKVHANHIAVWNGTAWDSVGHGFNYDVYSIEAWNGSLYAGGDFDSSGTAKMSYIARWNGSSWVELGSGMNSYVNALMPYKGLLYAAGNFDTAGGIPVDYITAWNGTVWDTVGEGLNQEASALDTNNGMLYVGGYFTTAENITVNGIASWNGVYWDSLSTGAGSGSVEAIASYKAGIVAGGNFSTAGHDSASSIAFWDTSAALKVNELNRSNKEITLFPNPANTTLNVYTSLQHTETVEFNLYNELGQPVLHELIGKALNTLSVTNLPSGIYFYRVTDENGGVLKADKEVIEH